MRLDPSQFAEQIWPILCTPLLEIYCSNFATLNHQLRSSFNWIPLRMLELAIKENKNDIAKFLLHIRPDILDCTDCDFLLWALEQLPTAERLVSVSYCPAKAA